jgi:hypothetical protein
MGLHSLVEKPLEKHPLERHTRRWENSMKMCFRNTDCEDELNGTGQVPYRTAGFGVDDVSFSGNAPIVLVLGGGGDNSVIR